VVALELHSTSAIMTEGSVTDWQWWAIGDPEFQEKWWAGGGGENGSGSGGREREGWKRKRSR
jgi:hypothetical protein